MPEWREYKRLGDIASISRGGNFQKKDFLEKAKKQKMATKNDIIVAVTSENIEDVCKCLAWLGDEDVAISGHTAIIHHMLETKYFVYFLHSEHFFIQKRKLAHGTKVIEVTPT